VPSGTESVLIPRGGAKSELPRVVEGYGKLCGFDFTTVYTTVYSIPPTLDLSRCHRLLMDAATSQSSAVRGVHALEGKCCERIGIVALNAGDRVPTMAPRQSWKDGFMPRLGGCEA